MLSFFFILPYYGKKHQTQPLKYFSHLIGHEGENSLLSYLKSEDLALELSSGCDDTMNCFSEFEINITLSKKGLEQYEKVIEAVYQYMQNIRDVGP